MVAAGDPPPLFRPRDERRLRDHRVSGPDRREVVPAEVLAMYAELHCHSNFSFLDGASHPDHLVSRAKEAGMTALALTDHDGLYGMVKFRNAAREQGIKPIIGAEMTLDGGANLRLLARNMTGYSNLCR